jgi:hypothetical protein
MSSGTVGQLLRFCWSLANRGFVFGNYFLYGLDDYLRIEHAHMSKTLAVNGFPRRPLYMCGVNFFGNSVDAANESAVTRYVVQSGGDVGGGSSAHASPLAEIAQ